MLVVQSRFVALYHIFVCVSVCIDDSFFPFLNFVVTFNFLYCFCCCCCLCCHCYMIVCVSVYVCRSVNMFIRERACMHGFGSLKIKISQSNISVFMFSSYIFVDIYALVYVFPSLFSVFFSVYSQLFIFFFAVNAYIMCANVFC